MLVLVSMSRLDSSQHCNQIKEAHRLTGLCLKVQAAALMRFFPLEMHCYVMSHKVLYLHYQDPGRLHIEMITGIAAAE